MERIGAQDMFGEVGSIAYLRERFELTAADIVKKVEKVISRKQQVSEKMTAVAKQIAKAGSE
jgi:transketolase